MKTSQRIVICSVSLAALFAPALSAQDAPDVVVPPPIAPGGPGGAARLQETLKKADADGDGKVTKAELLEFAKTEIDERFTRLDANVDGVFDEKDIKEVAARTPAANLQGPGARRRPGPGAAGGGPGAGPAGGPEGGPDGPPPGINIEELIKKLDKNTDGVIDVAEYGELIKMESESHFQRMDEDADGKLTVAELQKLQEKMRAAMQQRGPGGPGGGPGAGPAAGGRRPPGPPGARPGGPGGPGAPDVVVPPVPVRPGTEAAPAK